MKRVVIIGGGIAGLSAAYYLRSKPVQVTLIERSGRLGGKIGTERIGDLLIEQGPDSIFTMKPAAMELAIELGMGDQLIEPRQHDFSILVNGRLFHVPRALASLMPGAATALEKAEFFGASTRRRILREKDAPKGDGTDESIASFFRRRFGRRFSNLLAEPLLAGIHGGDPERLSMKALYPSYLGLEQKKGSLTGSGEAPPPAAQTSGAPARRAGFLSLRDGMESLVRELERNLEDVDIRLGCEVSEIESIEGGGLGIVVDGKLLESTEVVIAAPAGVASCLLRHIAPAAGEGLLRIPHTSTAVVTLAYSRSDFPKDLHGNGFLVPYTEKCDITGCTWTSNKWEGRAPEDTVLIRCFMGRDGGLDVDGYSDEDLIDRARREMSRILHPTRPPHFADLARWTRAMPQKVVGHTDLLESVERDLAGLPIHLIGASYRSSGIPDCVRDGREVAARITEQQE